VRIEEFLERLKGVRENGADSWMACCPAHDDKNPSMSVSAKGGKILVHCHAGCTAEAVVDALGLEMKDLFLVERSSTINAGDGGSSRNAGDGAEGAEAKVWDGEKKKRSGSHGKWVCDYEYHDEFGVVIYKQSRYVKDDGKKTFILKHPDPSSPFGWGYGLKKIGRNRVPYHLPEVIAAAKAGRTLAICEGEKDVDNVRALGFSATCNVCGAGNWGVDFPEGWGRWFKGLAGIVIIADNDSETIERVKRGKKVVEPFLAGQRHAWDVKRQLEAAGFDGVIRLMVMPDVEGRHVKDFTEWRDARVALGMSADKAAFRDAVKNAAPWPKEWEFGDAGAATNGAPAEKGRRAASSDRTQTMSAAEARFGRPRPRTPAGLDRAFEVDFRPGGSGVVNFWLDEKEFFHCWQTTDGEGRTTEHKEWRALPLVMMIAHAGWMVAAAVPGDKGLSASMRSDVAAVVALLWLRARGLFFWDENSKGFQTSLYFDRARGVLMRVRSDEFQAFLATETGLNREKVTFKCLMALIDDAALDGSVSRGVVPSAMWDRRGDAVYISNGDAQMYRLKGGAVELVQNGTDGVVFVRGKTLAPWKLLEGGGVDPFENAMLFKGASWAEPSGPMNVRLWVLNLFACHKTKPILLITGLAQSGKTRMAKGIKEILGVRVDGRLDLSVQQAEKGDKGADAFWVTVNDGKLEVFDNLDTKVDWVGDALQNVATDGQTKRRTLYKTDGVTILRANANLILTSNNPLFSTEGAGGMADRLIVINLQTNRSGTKDTELSVEIATHRNEYLTWIARTVAAALVDDKPVDAAINRRHPDYGIFSVKCGRAFGDEQGVVHALGHAEAEKALLPLINDTIAKEILGVLMRENCSMRFTAAEMSQRILADMDGEPDEKTKQMYGARRVAKCIARYLRQFETLFAWQEPRIVTGNRVYETLGLSMIGGVKVDMVDFMGRFRENPIEAGAHGGLTETSISNPPNPPDAATRAGAGAETPFQEKKEDIEDLEEGDYGDLLF